MVRTKTANLYKRKNDVEWRSHEPSRLETFSDAVFAFAVTLIIVSLEVPKTFTELYETLKGTISFAVCFALLFNIWNSQNIYFRRYGLNDSLTVFLNGTLLFTVVIYVYPLKFLAGLVFFDNSYTLNGHPHEMIKAAQTPLLMLIYGLGFTVINVLFCLMYANAIKHKDDLKLTELEVFITKTEIGINLLLTVVGVIAILLAWFLPVEYSGQSGVFYMIIPVAYFVWFSYRGKKSRKRFGI
jgi:uncharacterized membrane protein